MILVYLSGGCDSAAVLIDFLKNTNLQVMAHHCVLKSVKARWECELESCKSIIQYCRENIRDVEFTTTTMDFMHLKACANQIDPILFASSGIMQMICDTRISAVAYGYYSYSNAHNLDDIIKRMEQFSISRKIVTVFPNDKKTKLGVYESLPDPVKKMIWWCRAPNWLDGFPEPCGTCIACKNIGQVKAGKNVNHS